MRWLSGMILAGCLLTVPAGPATGAVGCTLADLRAVPPGDRLELLDDFRSGLSATDRRRFDRALPRDAGGGIARCDGIARSRASCEAAAYLPALRRTRLAARFVATRCPAIRAATPLR